MYWSVPEPPDVAWEQLAEEVVVDLVVVVVVLVLEVVVVRIEVVVVDVLEVELGGRLSSKKSVLLRTYYTIPSKVMSSYHWLYQSLR